MLDEPSAGPPELPVLNMSNRLRRSPLFDRVKGAGARLPIADSKVLKLPNSGKRHPLTHLERGVLSFLCAGGTSIPADDAGRFAMLGTSLAREAWYAGDASPVPAACDADRLGIDANLLAACLRDAGVGVEHLACVAVA
ncbi:MAG: hypothetical protein AAGH68_01530, partial [Pseudomonadota bacterium]